MAIVDNATDDRSYLMMNIVKSNGFCKIQWSPSFHDLGLMIIFEEQNICVKCDTHLIYTLSGVTGNLAHSAGLEPTGLRWDMIIMEIMMLLTETREVCEY